MWYMFVVWSVFPSGKETKNVVQTETNLGAVYGEGVIAESTVHKWLASFRNRNCDPKQRERYDRPAVVHDD